MSAEVLGSASQSASARPAPVVSRPPLSAMLEPALVNRLVAVAVAVFFAPAGVALAGLFGGEGGLPTLPVLCGALGASGLLAAGFAVLLAGAPHAKDLRVGRALCAALGLEAALLALALGARFLA